MSEARRAAIIFVAAFALLFLMYGNRLILGTNDEGIYLEGAQRIVEGQKLYVDFFGYMSPGSYWLLAWSFRALGFTMVAGRIPVLLDFALTCAVVYWLTARLASPRAAAVNTVFFAVLETAQATILTAQHRWDSAVISVLAVAMVVHAQQTESRWWMALAGALSAFAAVFTPSIALAGAATLFWLVIWPKGRPLAIPFAAGCAATTIAVGVVLWAGGILPGFIYQLYWLSRNYSAVNIMPYGSIIGGYRDLLSGGPSLEWAFRVGVVICLALPAILPATSILGWGAAFWRDRKNRDLRAKAPVVIYLTLCMATYVVSTYPRMDVMHLAYVAAVPYALTAALVSAYLPERGWRVLFLSGTFMTMVFCFYTARILLADTRLRTPVGTVRVERDSAPQVEALLARVHPGDGLFVHPYQPLFYFLTQGKNPTRYAYLAPGMMREPAELFTLQALAQNPPEWILHGDIAPEEFLRVMPSGDAEGVGFKLLERWIHSRYAAFKPEVIVNGYVLYRQVRNAPPFDVFREEPAAQR